MARPPYHIARQEHVGDMLDHLRELGRLVWRWGYADRSAISHVCQNGGEWEALGTKAAEQVAQAECDALSIRWKPVPHPGGEAQRAKVVSWIANQKTS